MSILIMLFAGLMARAETISLRPLVAVEQTVRDDLVLILDKAGLKDSVTFEIQNGGADDAQIVCTGDRIKIAVSRGENWSQVYYMALQRLGFLFPHPRMQISPELKNMKKMCGRTFHWSPALKYAGFHLHTLHPNEWVHGFLMGETQIAYDTIRWLARNQQNVFDLSLLRNEDELIFSRLKPALQLAREFGIHAGVAVGFALSQQRVYKMIPLWATFSDTASTYYLERNLKRLLENLDLSFVDFEAGTSEFSSTNYERSILWMNTAAKIAGEKGVKIFIKIHTSTKQSHPKYGNFNFLPQYADPSVGILPHTVYLYGIDDEHAPMYGNDNFHSIRDFMLAENSKRPTMFYPETSYYLGLDIDAPLLLTDYLLTRARDFEFIYRHQIPAQINFTTGQENGYWLFDWTVTLLNNLDYHFDPQIGLKLMGEDTAAWQKIIDFQHEQFIQNGLISIVTFADLVDEMFAPFEVIHRRNLLKTLAHDPQALQVEIQKLQTAIPKIPDVTLKNAELNLLWKVTALRIQHALDVRLALQNPAQKNEWLDKAAELRAKAKKLLETYRKEYERYPEARIFERQTNLTSYPYGYGYASDSLHYWEREERKVRENRYEFYFMPLLTIPDLLRGWVF